jgi:Nucleotidyl transferase AbiEii toxin, Type IV TA system
MTKRPLTNVAASVRDRLLNRSRQTGEDFGFLLQRYAAERLLYRLGESTHRDQYVLKGAMLFALWGGLVYRPTRDLDFTGYGKTDADDVIVTFKEVCAVPVADDGLVFDPATVTAAPIRDETEYRGLRVTLRAMLGEARIDMQIDIGFANATSPAPMTFTTRRCWMLRLRISRPIRTRRWSRKSFTRWSCSASAPAA